MPWGFAIAAGGAIIGSSIQASGQESAAGTQAGMFNTIVGQEQPYIQGGNNAETSLQKLLGLQGGAGPGGLPNGYLTQQFNPTQQELDNYPGYQFQQQQGDQAVQNSAAATTGAVSGSALKQLSTFNQGLAASNYSNYFNQFQTQQNNIFNRLSTIAGLGQNAAGNLGNNGAQLGTGIAQAQAAAAGSIGAGVSSAGSNLGQSYLLSNFLNNGGSGNSGSFDSSSLGGIDDNLLTGSEITPWE